MDERYRSELDALRLTAAGRQALLRSLAGRRADAPRPRRVLRRLVVVAAAVICALAGAVGAVVAGAPVLRGYFGGGAGYEQSAALLGRSVTVDGWTMTLTDCVGDDRYLYLGLELTAPEGTVLDEETYLLEEDLAFPDLGHYLMTWECRMLPDPDPADNRLYFMVRAQGSGGFQEGSFNGTRLALSLSGLRHPDAWDEGAQRWAFRSDSGAVWDFGTLRVSYPDSTIRLEPNLPVTTLGVEAVITRVEVSPIGVYVRIEGDALVGHHEWVPKNAPDGYYGCVEYQEITLHTRDGGAIAPYDSLSGSGCSGGNREHPEPGYLVLVRANDTLMDLDSLEEIEICGVRIPLH